MAMRSKEFVGTAERIKSYELSVKSLIESIKDTLSGLSEKKSSLEGRLSSLYAELAAAENDYDDGSDYGLIASIENQIDQTSDELEAIEEDLSQTSGELEKAEQEYEKVEEEKQQTLFEIQQRARTYSQDMSKIGSAYGAYASIGQSISQSIQANYDALAQAASILDSSIGDIGAGQGSVGGNLEDSNGFGILGSSGTATAIAGANNIRPTNSTSGVMRSSQGSVSYASAGSLKTANGENIGIRPPSFKSSQGSSVSRSSVGTISGELQGNSVNTRNFTSKQAAHNNGVLRGKCVSGGISGLEKNKSKNCRIIQGINARMVEHATMNTPRTIEEMRKQMTPEQQAYFDSAIAAGGGVEGQRAHLRGTGEEYYLTSSSSRRASGNFLTKENPGSTSQERKENLQLPTGNDAAKVEKVQSVIPTVILESKVSPQEEWATKSGYVAKEGMRQTFTPNRNINGAIAAGLYVVTYDELLDELNGAKLDGSDPSKSGKIAGSSSVHAMRLNAERDVFSSTQEKNDSFSDQLKRNYGTSIVQKISESKSFIDLNNIIKTEQIARNCIWGDIDLELAKEWTLTIYTARQKSGMQDIIDVMPVVGTISAAITDIRERLTVEYRKDYLKRFPSITKEDLKEVVSYNVEKVIASMFDIEDDVVAISVAAERGNDIQNVGDKTISAKYSGILLNVTTQNNTIQSMNDRLAYGEKIGSTPQKCDSLLYIANHEFAHQIDAILKISNDEKIISYFDKFSSCGKDKQKKLLSTYAASDVYEFVAEAYAEAMTSPTPRKIAIYVKQKFDDAASEYRKKEEEYIKELERIKGQVW